MIPIQTLPVQRPSAKTRKNAPELPFLQKVHCAWGSKSLLNTVEIPCQQGEKSRRR